MENTQNTFIDRLVAERTELADKLDKLESFLAKEDAKDKVGDYQFTKLNEQKYFMIKYMMILDDRIANLNTGHIQEQTFGQKAVGLSFNHAKGIVGQNVHIAKLLFADLIDLNEFSYMERIHEQPKSTDKDGAVKYPMLSWTTNVFRTAAFNAIIAAQMALVKVLTWKD